LSYQWFYNETNLVGAEQSLALTNVQPAQAGAYTLLVTNVAGSISNVVTLIVLSPPILLFPEITTNQAFAFVLHGDTGQTYLIEATTNLLDWDQIGFLSNAAGQTPFVDTNALNSVFRMYRARLVP
jgi:hypothetical protein